MWCLSKGVGVNSVRLLGMVEFTNLTCSMRDTNVSVFLDYSGNVLVFVVQNTALGPEDRDIIVPFRVIRITYN